MDTDVQNVETTTAESSTATNSAKQFADSDLKTGEVVNAQSEDTSAGTTGDSVNEKSKNRFQELANERSHYKTMAEQQAEVLRQNAELIKKYEAQGINALQQFGATGTSLEIQALKEEMAWEKAYAKFPELKEDKDLDELVYANYIARRNLGENVAPEAIAKDVMSYLDKKLSQTKSQAYEQAENEITQKLSVNSKPRRSDSRGVATDVSTLKTRARSGDAEALEALADLI